ncbi:UNVERIFIED_CONTAM: hypothetical protein HDU68_010548 [Siphonaria sp. JEL0065]|nr:hypothetical protein HDU68_010548 [Siphonaria sp. JEL0065]
MTTPTHDHTVSTESELKQSLNEGDADEYNPEEAADEANAPPQSAPEDEYDPEEAAMEIENDDDDEPSPDSKPHEEYDPIASASVSENEPVATITSSEELALPVADLSQRNLPPLPEDVSYDFKPAPPTSVATPVAYVDPAQQEYYQQYAAYYQQQQMMAAYAQAHHAATLSNQQQTPSAPVVPASSSVNSANAPVSTISPKPPLSQEEEEEEEEVESGTVHIPQQPLDPEAKRAKYINSGPPPGHPLWEEQQRKLQQQQGTPQTSHQSASQQSARGSKRPSNGPTAAQRNTTGDGNCVTPGTAVSHSNEIVSVIVQAARAAHSAGLENPHQFHPRFSVAFSSPPSLVNQMPLNARLFLGNLITDRTDRFEVAAIFANYGNIVEVLLKNGFGFVQYTDPIACSEAIRLEQGRLIGGGAVDLKLSRDKPGLAPSREARDKSPPRWDTKVDRSSGARRDRSRSRERRGSNDVSSRRDRERSRSRDRRPTSGRDRDRSRSRDRRGDGRRDDRDRDRDRDRRDDRRSRYDDDDDRRSSRYDDDRKSRVDDRRDDTKSRRAASPPRRSRFDSPHIPKPAVGGLSGLQQAQMLLQQKAAAANSSSSTPTPSAASGLPAFLTQQDQPKPTIHTVDLSSLKTSDFPLPRRFGTAVPECQFILIDNPDRSFVSRVENVMRAAGIVVDTLTYNPHHSLRHVVQQMMAENVRAVIFIERHHVQTGKISIHMFHSGGRVSEYDNVGFDFAASLVLQERQARATTTNPLANILGNLGGQQQQEQQLQQLQQQQHQQQQNLGQANIFAQFAAQQQQQQQQAQPNAALLGLLASALSGGGANANPLAALTALSGLGQLGGGDANSLLALMSQLQGQQQQQQIPQQQQPLQNTGLMGLNNLFQQQKPQQPIQQQPQQSQPPQQQQQQQQNQQQSGLMGLLAGLQQQQAPPQPVVQQQPPQQAGFAGNQLSGLLSLLGGQQQPQQQQLQQPQQQYNTYGGLLNAQQPNLSTTGVMPTNPSFGSTGVIPGGNNPATVVPSADGDILSRLKQLQQLQQMQPPPRQ